MRKTTLAPRQLLRSVHMEKSYLSKAGYTWCCTTGNPSLEVAPEQRKAPVNIDSRQTVDRGKVNPGARGLTLTWLVRGCVATPVEN